MELEFLASLTAQSTLVELPAHDETLELSSRGQSLADLLARHPRLPGVVLTENGAVRGAISRGQYLRLIGRYLGQEVFHPRPLSLMLEAIEASEGEAGMLQLGTYQRQLHRCEDLVAELGQRDVVSLADLTRIASGLAELESLSSETRQLIEHFRQLGHRPAGSNGEADPDLLRDVESLVRDLAQRLGKSVRFFSHAKSEDIPEQYLDLTRDLLIQGSRNALARSRRSAAAPAAF